MHALILHPGARRALLQSSKGLLASWTESDYFPWLRQRTRHNGYTPSEPRFRNGWLLSSVCSHTREWRGPLSHGNLCSGCL